MALRPVQRFHRSRKHALHLHGPDNARTLTRVLVDTKVTPMKKELRARIRGLLNSLSPEEINERSHQAAQLLFQTPEYRNAEIMMIYLSLPQEAETDDIVLQAWQDRKKVVAPRVSWESRQMVPVEIRDLNEDVTEREYGIREPIHGLPIPISLVELVIVPGLGFDPYGNRLGRGRGFYDRFLGKPEFRGTACGFALECQFVGNIAASAHDVKMKMLVTDQAVRRFDR